MSDEDLLRHALATLGPYRGHLVVVGAWAHRLFARHPLGRALQYDPLTTEDADLAAPLRLAIDGDAIPKRLIDAGFRQNLRGVDTQPVMRFFAAEHDGFYVEFIAPLNGSPTDKQGEPRTRVKVGGVNAALLRHVDVLLVDPWELDLANAVVARVANPASYLAQKVLTKRNGPDNQGKAAKDLLYIHDTLLMFGANLEHLQPLAVRVLATMLPKHADAVRSFDFARDPVRLARAAAIARRTGRPTPPTAAAIAATCRAGFAALFGA